RPKPPGLADFRDSEERSEARVVVIADGDLIRNDFNLRTDEPLPLGVDPYSQTTYANEDFLLKSLDYLTDENGLILSRNKQIKIRPLDKIKVKEEKLFWQVLNVALPIVLILLFGLLKYWLRKRKYG
ncbi:MAG: gliding motility-associated ABC transporter substrate-binding protein GldG, partial [Cyclobacteriaceae bacterium]|nr:gliding motility-associated ABC transporter substrate-binding protein GldG [Cyclobacteriaceae bacterium HetDA_MAG_MS6]